MRRLLLALAITLPSAASAADVTQLANTKMAALFMSIESVCLMGESLWEPFVTRVAIDTGEEWADVADQAANEADKMIHNIVVNGDINGFCILGDTMVDAAEKGPKT